MKMFQPLTHQLCLKQYLPNPELGRAKQVMFTKHSSWWGTALKAKNMSQLIFSWWPEVMCQRGKLQIGKTSFPSSSAQSIANSNMKKTRVSSWFNTASTF
jgi:hypothetical protein